MDRVRQDTFVEVNKLLKFIYLSSCVDRLLGSGLRAVAILHLSNGVSVCRCVWGRGAMKMRAHIHRIYVMNAIHPNVLLG